MLEPGQRGRLAEALFAATDHWAVALHVNKGLAGADAADLAAAKDTAMNHAVLDAFALAIIAGGEPDAYRYLVDRAPDLGAARRDAKAIGDAADKLRASGTRLRLLCLGGRLFRRPMAAVLLGPNYRRLLAVKKKYDPAGLFFVHHGVGSEAWSPDGFTRVD